MILRTLFTRAATALVFIAAAGLAHANEPDTRTMSSPASTSLRGQITHPFGTTVLYDQSGVETTNLIAEYFTDFPTFRSQIADDFVVTSAANWTILSVIVLENTASATNLPGTTFNVAIYPDNAGTPGVEAVCDYAALAATFDVTRTLATIPLLPLSESCVLVPGHYWMTATPVIDFASGGYYYASLRDTGIGIGATPVWRNPGGAYGGHCPDWTSISTCGDLGAGYPASTGAVFQLVGHTGGQPGHIDFTVGLAEDNGNASQCGTSTNLQATVGDQINFCYTVVNRSPLALNFQSLSDTVTGDILSYTPIVIAPGASYQHNRIVTAVETQTALATWQGSVDKPGYVASAGSYSFVDIVATGTALDLQDDTGATVTTPFPITLGDVTSNTLCIENNGIIFVGLTGACINHFYNFPLPNFRFAAPAIMPFWDDLYGGGNVYHQTIGVAPNRRFVIEYHDKNTSSAILDPGYTFEVVLNESDGSIDFNYANVTIAADAGHSNGIGASVALQLSTRLANIYSENTASLSDGQNVHWQRRPDPVSFSNSAAVTLDVGAPVIFAIPGPVDATAPVNTSIVTPFFLLNAGNRDLDWTILEAGGRNVSQLAPRYRRPLASHGKTHVGSPDVSERATGGDQLATPATALLGNEAVPAFGMAYFAEGNQFVRFDAAAPATLTSIAAVSDTFYAGTFANFDFSVEYLVSATTGGLYSISTTTGATHLIGSTGLPAAEVAMAISWDSTTGNTYLMSANCAATPVYSNFYSINLATAGLTLIASDIGQQVCNVTMAVDQVSGDLWSIDATNDVLQRFNKTTGQLTWVSFLDIDVDHAQAMEFDNSTGTLYLAAFVDNVGKMYRLNVENGDTTLIGLIGSGVQTAGFVIAKLTPPCDRPENISWMRLSDYSGTAIPRGYSTVGVTLDASGLALGDHAATLCVHSNDPLSRRTVVPVSFRVTDGTIDLIFKSGFDSN